MPTQPLNEAQSASVANPREGADPTLLSRAAT
jgi:hypothetical protein